MKDFSKATLRPWVIETEGNDYLHICNKDVIEVVASLTAEPMDYNTKANAELIVTAVNNFDKMKEALEEVSRYFHKRANKGKWSKRINTEIEQLLESLK